MFDHLSSKISQALQHLRGKKTLSEVQVTKTIASLKTALLEADVSFLVVEELMSTLKTKAIGKKVVKGVSPEQQFIKIVQDELALIMGNSTGELSLGRPPFPILIVGPNGQGKTTFSGKLAHRLHHQKKRVLLVPADTFRPAAKEQMQTLAKRAGVDCFDSDLTTSPREILSAALEEAKKHKKEAVIIDTAGRLHDDDSSMEQVKEMAMAIKDHSPEILLVADAMTGRQAVPMAKRFHAAVHLTGVVLSKVDSDARGGAAISIRHMVGVPLRYLSTGEGLEDLELFHPDRLASRILGQGDVAGLVEKAERLIEQKEAEKAAKAIEKKKFGIDTFIDQIKMMERLGPLTSVAGMLPGLGTALRQAKDQAGVMENKFHHYKVMASSMTKAEKRNYSLLTGPRLERIAKGSGHSVRDVREFLSHFKKIKTVVETLPLNKMTSLSPKNPPKKHNHGRWGKSFFRGKKRS